MIRVVAVLVLTLSWVASSVLASNVPGEISYQGYLKESNIPVTGQRNFTFNFYTSASGTEGPIWSDNQQLQVQEGRFSTNITGLTPEMFANGAVWVGISVESGPEGSRTRLVSQPFTLRTATIDGADGGTINGDVRVSSRLSVAPYVNQIRELYVFGSAQVDSGGLYIDDENFRIHKDVLSNGPTIKFDTNDSIVFDRAANSMYVYIGGAEKLKVNSTGVTTSVLEVTGGSDIAEPFEVTDLGGAPVGAVMVIDADHPGQLKLSTRSYDTRVAGVVSGAGGVKPGLTLNQTGSFPNGTNIALSGRVYCLVDASTGAIEPGDLLTTSNTPGHAMKAIDKLRAQGAVIGKAMSGLKSGMGLVLILVNLQ